jgi:hypothetical protein
MEEGFRDNVYQVVIFMAVRLIFGHILADVQAHVECKSRGSQVINNTFSLPYI